MNIVIAAGGTGGHINPGIAIAQEIKKNKPDANIIFIGTLYGLEKELVPKAGFNIEFIRAKGLGGNILKKIKALGSNFMGITDTYKILKRIKPTMVIGTGGYVCAPVLFTAKKLLKIPVFIHESNAIAGKTNKLIGGFADGVAVGFDKAKESFKSKNIVVTGNPIKSEIANLKKVNGDKKEILIFGGSQGARVINNAVIELIAEFNGNLPYNITYATGKNQYEGVLEELTNRGIKIDTSIKILPYIDNMEEALSKAHLVVSRSGALTISELCVAGIPAILIPLSTAAENHQEYNAKIMESVGGAKIILDAELTSVKLKNSIDEMCEKDFSKVEGKLKELMPVDGSRRFYKMIEKYFN